MKSEEIMLPSTGAEYLSARARERGITNLVARVKRAEKRLSLTFDRDGVFEYVQREFGDMPLRRLHEMTDLVMAERAK